MGSIWSDIVARVEGLLRWWVTISPWERGLRVRAGKNVKSLGPGIHAAIPGLDVVHRQTIRLRTLDLGVQNLTTTDRKTLTLSGTVRFRVASLRQLYDSLHHPDETVIDLTMGAIADYVSTHSSDEITPASVQAAASEATRLERYGLGDVGVSLTDFAYARTYRVIGDDRRTQYRGEALA